MISPAFGGSHVIWGTYFHGDLAQRVKVPWHDRCLPSTSITTPALLLLLTRWTMLDAAVGGLRGEKPRAAANELVGAFASCFHAGALANVVFEVAVVQRWQCPWPAPSEIPDAAVLQIPCVNGICDLSSLLEASGRHWSLRWWLGWVWVVAEVVVGAGVGMVW